MRRIALLLAGALLIAAALPGVVAAKPTAGSWSVPIAVTQPDGQSANGVLEITRFATQNGQVVALGSFTGTITNAGVSQTGTDTGLAIPVIAASCDILSLTLGPLHLDILGLVVDLNQVVLNITAVPGAGNLLGNLLCAVAGLLDGGGPLVGIVALLNRILAILQL